MTFDSGKLIRDKVPAILQEQGKSACCDVLDEATYEKLLNERFVEDVARYVREGTLEAMADIGEVMHAILALKKIPIEDFQKARMERMEELGGYGGRLYLTEVIEK